MDSRFLKNYTGSEYFPDIFTTVYSQPSIKY